MNQLTVLQWVGLAISWFFGGILLDVFKFLLSRIGNLTLDAIETLKDISQSARINVIENKIGVKVLVVEAGDFIIRRIIWILLAFFELFFWLLIWVVRASFFILMYLVIAVFFIPKLLISFVLKTTKTEAAFKSISTEILNNSLQTEITKKPLIQKEKSLFAGDSTTDAPPPAKRKK